jgi:hypothetical protein
MSYPAPTKPLHPERRAAQPLSYRSPRTSAGDEFVAYPAPTSGEGTPVRFAPIAPVTIYAGQTHQLLPTLEDVNGTTQRPTQRITYRSTSLQLPVSENGLLITACNPTVFSRKGASVHGNVVVSHGSINTTVDVTVTPYADDVVSD